MSPGADSLTVNNPQTWNGNFAFGGGKANDVFGGAVAMNASVIVDFSGLNSVSVNGGIGDGGNALGLTLTGNGRSMTLGGNNTYTGPTTVAAGTVSLASSLSTSSAITVNSGATIQFQTQTQGTGFASNITGAGAVSGTAGVVVLSGANSYTGGTTPVNGNDGSFFFDNDNALGTGPITFNNSTSRGFGSVDATSHTLANNIIFSSATSSTGYSFGRDLNRSPNRGGTGNLTFNGTVSIAGATPIINVSDSTTVVTFNGVVSSTGVYGITLNSTNGAGTLVLANTNTYTGPTQVNGGGARLDQYGRGRLLGTHPQRRHAQTPQRHEPCLVRHLRRQREHYRQRRH